MPKLDETENQEKDKYTVRTTSNLPAEMRSWEQDLKVALPRYPEERQTKQARVGLACLKRVYENRQSDNNNF